jgi:hypothetical protein
MIRDVKPIGEELIRDMNKEEEEKDLISFLNGFAPPESKPLLQEPPKPSPPVTFKPVNPEIQSLTISLNH